MCPVFEALILELWAKFARIFSEVVGKGQLRKSRQGCHW